MMTNKNGEYLKPDYFDPGPPKFKRGDSVCLISANSTNPIMTVKSIVWGPGRDGLRTVVEVYRGAVRWVWFDNSNNLKEMDFYQDTLRLATGVDLENVEKFISQKAQAASLSVNQGKT